MADVKLPAVWMQSFLGEIAEDISYGYTAASTTEEIGPRMLRITDIQDNSVDWDSVPFCKIDSHRELKYLLSEGDLVFARTGATVGKSYLIKGNVPSAVYASYLIRVRCSKEIYISYLSHFFNAPTYWGQITEFSSGIGQPNVNGTKLKGLLIPIPSLAEQKVIAEKLDTLLAQVDSAKTRLGQIPQILKRFRQSVLAAAVSGKLTEEWRKDNLPLTEFNYCDVKTSPIPDDEKYFDEPECWLWCNLGSIVKLINGDRGKNYPNQSEYVEEGVPFINTGHIDPDGTLSLTRMNFITQEKYEILGSGKILENDLVYCLRGATMGKTAKVYPFLVGAIASSLVIVRPSRHILTDYCYYFLISPEAKFLIKKFDNGSAQPNLSAKSLSSYPIALPSLEEQTEIVRRVEQLFAYADTIEKQVQDALLRVNNLTQSILAKAFRGELTEQWRAENPDLISGENSAEALLAKIKAERETVKPKKKSAK